MIDHDRTTKRSVLILPYIYVKNTKKEMYNAIFLWKNFFYKTTEPGQIS